MKNYTDLMDRGYDHKFDIYADAVAGNAGRTVHEFIYKHGNKYFNCKVDESSKCCGVCDGSDGSCEYCSTDGDCFRDCNILECGRGGGFSQVPVVRISKHDEPCPPDYSQRGSNLHTQSVHWTMKDGHAGQFYKDISGATGIGKDKFANGNYDRGNSCPPSVSLGDGNDSWAYQMDYNVPKPVGYKASDVANPKKTAKKALNKSGNLKPQIDIALFELACDAWVGDGRDLVDPISVPILMISQAIEEMGKVVEYANEITEARQKEIIAAFLGAILFLIPVAGERLSFVGR